MTTVAVRQQTNAFRPINPSHRPEAPYAVRIVRDHAPSALTPMIDWLDQNSTDGWGIVSISVAIHEFRFASMSDARNFEERFVPFRIVAAPRAPTATLS